MQGWPDEIDTAVVIGYLALVIGVPVAGYTLMVLDVRAYLRSLRRALVSVKDYLTSTPEWVYKETPRCLMALGLRLPCTSEEVLAAYRKKVKHLHPDRGGDRKKFLTLQSQFEESLRVVEAYATAQAAKKHGK